MFAVLKNDKGVTLLEYMFIASLIFMMGVVGVGVLGRNTKEKFNAETICGGFGMDAENCQTE